MHYDRIDKEHMEKSLISLTILNTAYVSANKSMKKSFYIIKPCNGCWFLLLLLAVLRQWDAVSKVVLFCIGFVSFLVCQHSSH